MVDPPDLLHARIEFMTGFAFNPGTAVLPTCGVPAPVDPKRPRHARSRGQRGRAIRNCTGHVYRLEHCAAGSAIGVVAPVDWKSTRLKSSHANISYAVFCLKKKKNTTSTLTPYKPTYYPPPLPI